MELPKNQRGIFKMLHHIARYDQVKVAGCKWETPQITTHAERRALISGIKGRFQVNPNNFAGRGKLFREFEIAPAAGVQQTASRRQMLVNKLPVHGVVKLVAGIVLLIELLAFLSILRRKHRSPEACTVRKSPACGSLRWSSMHQFRWRAELPPVGGVSSVCRERKPCPYSASHW